MKIMFIIVAIVCMVFAIVCGIKDIRESNQILKKIDEIINEMEKMK